MHADCQCSSLTETVIDDYLTEPCNLQVCGNNLANHRIGLLRNPNVVEEVVSFTTAFLPPRMPQSKYLVQTFNRRCLCVCGEGRVGEGEPRAAQHVSLPLCHRGAG